MTLSEAKTKHAELVAKIRDYDRLYDSGNAAVSDWEYDTLYDELVALEERFHELETPDSPTQRVRGVPVEGFNRVEHLEPMLSLEKIKAAEHPTKEEEPDPDRRKRAQDENTLKEIGIASPFSVDEIKDLSKLLNRWKLRSDPVSAFLWQLLSKQHQEMLTNYQPSALNSNQVQDVVVKTLNKILGEPCIYDRERFKDISLRPETIDLMNRGPAGYSRAHLNRLLLQDAYPQELSKVKGFDATIRKQVGKKSIDYVLEPKVDGVSISVSYRNGKLFMGATRGDGKIGDDITANIRTIRAIPLELKIDDPPKLLEVRGEAYISISDFDKLNAKLQAAGEEPFPNARNATAGTLKQLDPRIVRQRPIRAVFYALGAYEGLHFSTHSEVLEFLKNAGLPTQPVWWVCNGIEEVFDRYRNDVVCDYDEAKDLRTKLAYEVDGIVLKVNDLTDRQKIPSKTKAPGYAVVHKPIPWITPAETVLRAITVQVGRTGVLTPVAELDPVSVQGSTVARATLHNEDEIKKKDIRIGDTVIVRKAGMVIPEVVEVVKSKRPPNTEPFNFSAHVGDKCPACGGQIVRDPGFAAWRCQNIAGCPAQSVRRIQFMAQRNALDIEGLGSVVAEKLIETGLVKEWLELFDLKVEPLGELNLGTKEEPRIFGVKNATKVYEALERARSFSLARWLLALGIPNVGETTAYQMGALHRNLDDLAASPILEDALTLNELLKEVLKVNPDATNAENMGPVRLERIEKQKEEKIVREGLKKDLTPDEIVSIKAKCLKLKSEIAGLKKAEPAERERRIQQNEKLNAEIEMVYDRLKKANVKTHFEKLEKKDKKNSKKGPPIISITTEIEPEAARSIRGFFDSTAGREIRKRLNDLGIFPKGGKTQLFPEAQSQPFSGMNFVFTGSLKSMTRDMAAQAIRARGGIIVGKVSKNTNFLVTGEDPGTKLQEAERLGVAIIKEGEFIIKLGAEAKDLKGETPNEAQGKLL